jgi:hypothetical protein
VAAADACGEEAGGEPTACRSEESRACWTGEQGKVVDAECGSSDTDSACARSGSREGSEWGPCRRKPGGDAQGTGSNNPESCEGMRPWR